MIPDKQDQISQIFVSCQGNWLPPQDLAGFDPCVLGMAVTPPALCPVLAPQDKQDIEGGG